jgi:hypothetical protein
VVAFATLLSSGKSDAVAVRAAAALITHVTRAGWDHVRTFLHSRPDLVRSVLGEVFYGERFLSTKAGPGSGPASMTPEQLGELVCLALEAFPPETDPKHDGAHFITPDVLCRVPAAATATDAPISIPLEVKLSFNPQARSGLHNSRAATSYKRQQRVGLSRSSGWMARGFPQRIVPCGPVLRPLKMI